MCELFTIQYGLCMTVVYSFTINVCRSLEHSTILYEDPQQLPLLRLSWNKQDHNYLATFAMEKAEVGYNAYVVINISVNIVITTCMCICN